jgi:hypothetical protein
MVLASNGNGDQHIPHRAAAMSTIGLVMVLESNGYGVGE